MQKSEAIPGGLVPASQSQTGYLHGLFVLCLVAGLCGGTISTLLSVYLQPISQQLLSAHRYPGWMPPLVNASFVAGWAAGGMLWGLGADRWGRKPMLVGALALTGLATLLTGFTTNAFQLLGCRIASGFGVGGILVLSFTLVAEVWPPQRRALIAGLLSIAFPAGIFAAGLLAMVTNQWQQAFYVGLLPLGLAMLAFYTVQETMAWQQKNAEKPASALPAPSATLSSGRHYYGAALFGCMLIGLWAIFLWLPAWAGSLKPHPGIGNAAGLSMMLMGSGGLLGGALSGIVVSSMGYKRALLVCFAAACLITLGLFGLAQHFNYFAAAAIFLMAFNFGASQGILSALIPQLFKVEQRAASTGFCFNAARILTAIAVLVVGTANQTPENYGTTLLLCSIIFIPGLVLAFRLPPLQNQ